MTVMARVCMVPRHGGGFIDVVEVEERGENAILLNTVSAGGALTGTPTTLSKLAAHAMARAILRVEIAGQLAALAAAKDEARRARSKLRRVQDADRARRRRNQERALARKRGGAA